MPAKNPPTGTDADLNVMTLQPLFADEDKARAFFESKRWPNGPVCPHCKTTDVYKLTAKPGSKSPVRPGVYKCSDCRKQFTVRVGSIFEDSKLPLRHWLYAIHLMTSSKKGVSSHQIARELGITVKSAWFVTHRIREAMKREPMAGMLKGELEADECYVGARKPRYKGTSPMGRGTTKKRSWFWLSGAAKPTASRSITSTRKRSAKKSSTSRRATRLSSPTSFQFIG